MRSEVVVASWLDESDKTLIARGSVATVLSEAGAGSQDPIVVVLEAAGAALHVVAGDASGTVLIWYPPGYAQDGIGSLHSMGDAEAAASDLWEPPLTAYYFGHHTEFPRWSVVAHELGQRAAEEFCERPTEPPAAVAWQAD